MESTITQIFCSREKQLTVMNETCNHSTIFASFTNKGIRILNDINIVCTNIVLYWQERKFPYFLLLDFFFKKSKISCYVMFFHAENLKLKQILPIIHGEKRLRYMGLKSYSCQSYPQVIFHWNKRIRPKSTLYQLPS